LKEITNQDQGVGPGEISEFSTLGTFPGYSKKCKQITPSLLQMTYFFLYMTLNSLQWPTLGRNSQSESRGGAKWILQLRTLWKYV